MDKAFKQIRAGASEKEYVFYSNRGKEAFVNLDFEKSNEYKEKARIAYERRKKDIEPDNYLEGILD